MRVGSFLMVCSWVDSLIIIIKVSIIRVTTNMYPENTIQRSTRRGAAIQKTLGVSRCLAQQNLKVTSIKHSTLQNSSTKQ